MRVSGGGSLWALVVLLVMGIAAFATLTLRGIERRAARVATVDVRCTLELAVNALRCEVLAGALRMQAAPPRRMIGLVAGGALIAAWAA